jgi:hypothetical protein
METSIDVNADNRVDYLLTFYRQAAKPRATLVAQVLTFPQATVRCAAAYALDVRGGWIRLTAPKSCVPATRPYRVRVMYSFNRSADRPIYGPLADFAPDAGRWFPG